MNSPRSTLRSSSPLRRAATAVVLAAVASLAPSALEGQTDDPRIRVGISAGGIGLWGAIFEYRWGDTGVELNLATFSWRDVSVSVVGKRYFGGGDLRPFVGLGLWSSTGRPEEDPRAGTALLALAPIGADWSLLDDHALGASLNINRGLWIRRSDPSDDTPISGRPIPLPAFYYRFVASR